MIKSFQCKETEKIFHRNYSKKFSKGINELSFRKLRMLNRAMGINDLKVPPGNRLEKLKGDREGEYSIRINDQWRICFNWSGHNALNVEIIDYH
jgi:proteic killer suppression protein